MKSTFKFLSTHDGETTPQPQAAPQAAAAPAPLPVEPTVPVSALSAIIGAANTQTAEARATEELRLARTQLDALRQQGVQVATQVPAQVSAPAVQPPAAPNNDAALQEIQALRAELHAEKMRNHRAAVINGYRAAGIGLVEALVNGSTEQELEASARIAAAEFEVMRQRIIAEQAAATQALLAQQALTQPQAPQVQTPQVPQGYTAGIAPVPPVPQYQNPVSAGQQFQPTQNDINRQISDMSSVSNVRGGGYAQNRDAIFQALRTGNLPAQGQYPAAQPGIPVGQGYNRPVPQAQAFQPVNIQPAANAHNFTPYYPTLGAQPVTYPNMPAQNPFNGAQGPVQTMPNQFHQVTPANMNPAGVQMSAPPQPESLDAGAPLDLGAARQASQMALTQMRARASSMQPTH